MRIIGTIDHPTLKVTVFQMNNRISVKFENEGYEQTFKLGEDERLRNLESIEKWIDPVFLDEVSHNMMRMHSCRLAAAARAFPVETESEFEQII